MRPTTMVAAAYLIAFGAFAQSRAVDPTINRHFGFYIRPDLGFGYLSSTESAGGASVTISGGAGLAGVAIGGALSENNILAFHIIDAVASNPSVSTSGGQSGSTSNTTYTLWGVGGQYTYYAMPVNVYFSGTLALTRVSVSANGNSSDSDWGLGVRLAAGKEWWVSDHWGLGVAGHFTFSTNQDPTGNGTSNTLNTWALGAVFSATYN